MTLRTVLVLSEGEDSPRARKDDRNGYSERVAKEESTRNPIRKGRSTYTRSCGAQFVREDFKATQQGTHFHDLINAFDQDPTSIRKKKSIEKDEGEFEGLINGG